MGSILSSKTWNILLVDDEPELVDILGQVFTRENLKVSQFTDPEEAYLWGKSNSFDLLVTDLKMAKLTGLDLHKKLKVYYPDLITILITGHQSLESAQQAIDSSVYAYVGKPFGMEEMMGSVRRALEKKELLDRNHQLVDEQQGLIEKLLTANKELKELDRLKSDFVSNVSHELRTPLTSMINILYNLNHGILGAVTEKQKEYLEMLEEDTNRLVNLINDILDLSRLEGGTVQLKRAPFYLREAVEAALKLVEAQKAAKDIQFFKEFRDGTENVLVLADRAKIEQVLINLVSNAVKYIGTGKRVWVELARSGERVSIAVRDEGIGIPEEDHARIFNRFEQLEKMARGGTKGTGLGLAIVKRILDLHGEGIQVRSIPQQGSTFIFRLPIQTNRQ